MMKKCSEMIEERKKKRTAIRERVDSVTKWFFIPFLFFHPFILFFLFHARFHFSGVACGSTFRTAVDVGAVWGFFSFFFRFFSFLFLKLVSFFGCFLGLRSLRWRHDFHSFGETPRKRRVSIKKRQQKSYKIFNQRLRLNLELDSVELIPDFPSLN